MERVQSTISVHSGPEDIGGKVLRVSPAIDADVEQAFSSPSNDPSPPASQPNHVVPFSMRGYAERHNGSTDISYVKLAPHVSDAALMDHGAQMLIRAKHDVKYDFGKPAKK